MLVYFCGLFRKYADLKEQLARFPKRTKCEQGSQTLTKNARRKTYEEITKRFTTKLTTIC